MKCKHYDFEYDDCGDKITRCNCFGEFAIQISSKPIEAGDSYGIQWLCPNCDFPSNDTLTMDMKYCWNCGIKLDWSEWEDKK